MRIFHLISTNRLGGAERVVLDLTYELERKGIEYEIGIVRNSHVPNDEMIREAQLEQLNYRVFPCHNRFDPRLIRSLLRYLKGGDFNIVHCHNYKSNFYGLVVSNILGIHTISTNHNWILSSPRLRFYAAIDSKVMRRFNKIVAVSEEVKSGMIKSGIPEKKISVIQNGINLKRLSSNSGGDLREEMGISKDAKVIGTIGSLTVEKGHTCLLKAFEKIVRRGVKAMLFLVGDGPLKHELINEAQTLGIEKFCFFTGFRRDVFRFLKMFDVFVLPSFSEGTPMVLLEAMAVGKPVCASRVGGIVKIIDDGTDGLLVAPGDDSELSDSIMKILTSADEGKKWGERAKSRIINSFSSDTMAEKYVELYKELSH